MPVLPLARSAAVRSRSDALLAIDLFCGAGGMSLGFEQSGFTICAAVDDNELCTEVHDLNFPDCVGICEDVTDLTGTSIRKKASIGATDIAVVVGGPPCQGFSIGGKGAASDPRNLMIYQFARLVVELQPRYFVMENVAGILLPQYDAMMERFLKKLDDGGYDCVDPIKRLNAVEFGVPQRRRRAFVLGWRRDQVAPTYPSPRRTRVTVADAISDLAAVEQGVIQADVFAGALGKPSTYSRGLRKRASDRGVALLHEKHCVTGFSRTEHSSKTIRRFSKVSPGGVDAISRYIRLSRDGVAPTLRAGTGFDNGRFMAPRPIHYEFDRCICLREAARLHSYPDWFVFDETKWHGFMQIGNSVPPALAHAVGKRIRRAVEQSDARRAEHRRRARA